MFLWFRSLLSKLIKMLIRFVEGLFDTIHRFMDKLIWRKGRVLKYFTKKKQNFSTQTQILNISARQKWSAPWNWPLWQLLYDHLPVSRGFLILKVWFGTFTTLHSCKTEIQNINLVLSGYSLVFHCVCLTIHASNYW